LARPTFGRRRRGKRKTRRKPKKLNKKYLGHVGLVRANPKPRLACGTWHDASHQAMLSLSARESLKMHHTVVILPHDVRSWACPSPGPEFEPDRCHIAWYLQKLSRFILIISSLIYFCQCLIHPFRSNSNPRGLASLVSTAANANQSATAIIPAVIVWRQARNATIQQSNRHSK
jgi:hypothetical protein